MKTSRSFQANFWRKPRFSHHKYTPKRQIKYSPNVRQSIHHHKMDTPPPPAIENSFEEETIWERLLGLNEMFPEALRNSVSKTVSKSASCSKWIYSTVRTITWLACSTAAILVLPISIESERQEYQQQMKRQERDIILGGEGGL